MPNIQYTKAEDEVHEYVGTPILRDGGYYYPASTVNAGVAKLIGIVNSLKVEIGIYKNSLK